MPLVSGGRSMSDGDVAALAEELAPVLRQVVAEELSRLYIQTSLKQTKEPRP